MTVLDKKTLLGQNANADPDAVERVEKALEALRANGVQDRSYELEPPFSQRSRIAARSREEGAASLAKLK